MNLSLWIFVTLQTLSVPYSNDEGMLTSPSPCVCACVLASIITWCVRYIFGFLCSAMSVVDVYFLLSTCQQETGWSAPLFLDWPTVSKTCWTSARWIGCPSYVRVQRSEGVNINHSAVHSKKKCNVLNFGLCYSSSSMSSWCFFWAFEDLDFYFERCKP